ncbi:hypothetical protein [Nocardioides sp. R-C-SC26]|uniref:hypothetical protein n=1 Tax=Nocardioides sp. R-C-SC26 TaxID=2870414 RepID=UPI001E53B25C|nr:hypothetical protein [Nocardioides sp. R-C-SC26]
MTQRRDRFDGAIAGVGTTSGVRVVVGRWVRSPFGTFADVMVERADGHRLLLAPSHEVADYVAATYSFDEVRVESVTVRAEAGRWSIDADSLRLELAIGRRTWLGRLLVLVPGPVARAPWWCALTDPVARVLLRGVRTRGSAGGGRREWYGATGHRHVTSAVGVLDGVDLGSLAPVSPPPRFGFSSTPPTPSVTTVTTTVATPA